MPPDNGEAQIVQEVGNLCPFIGTMAFPVMRKISTVQGQQMSPEIQYGMHVCVQARCAFWGEDGCVVKLGLESLPRIEKGLAPLQSFFGGK